MVDPFYVVSRALHLWFALCGLFISMFQLYIIKKRKIKIEVKYALHYCCFFTLFFYLFNCMDPDGVFKIFPYLFLSLIEQMVGACISTGLCLIIYGHFHAHYLSFKQHPPSCLRLILILSVVSNTFLNVVSSSLCYGLNLEFYCSLGDCSSLLWLITIIATDLYAYFLIRKLVKTGLEMQPIIQTPSSSSISLEMYSSNQQNKLSHGSFDQLLRKMRTFHLVVTSLALFFVMISIKEGITSVKAGRTPPIYPDPNRFTFKITAEGYIFLFVWTIFTWWAWIPVFTKESPSSPQLENPHQINENDFLTASPTVRRNFQSHS